uniref:General transcription factor IIH subunit 4 n=1 Tax=Trypanosoma congolense (strain IL3000) TaxID=1068625 RepID=G0UWA5_TRYCI|nr:conserved hypothetical protein [Trypanosoma congolense IL3000]
MTSIFIEQVLSYPHRDALVTECPALLLLCYQEIVAALHCDRRIKDPLSAQDEVATLLSISTTYELTDRVFEDGPPTSGPPTPLWKALRECLECAWDPQENSTRRRKLLEVAGVARFSGEDRMPLAEASLQNALNTSRRRLREVTACVLAGSLEPLGERRGEPISAMLHFSRLIPPPSEAARITCEGLSFCMQSLQQQWWTLVSVALDRVLTLTSGKGVTRATLWQLLAVLFALDASDYVYPFPSKEEDLEAFHLLARLSEVGLVYPLLCNGRKCFVLSPHFHHAICWSSVPSLCAAALLDNPNQTPCPLRREDEDTIITETNFRLYAYTRNPDLLGILDQFAVKEIDIDGIIVCYRVTRSSFALALRKGIDAKHILQFLTLKAHPSMVRKDGGASRDVSDNLALNSVAGFGKPSEVHQSTVIPQSFCDQLMTWERECRRLVFRHDMVLLKNVSAEQMGVLLDCLSSSGERHAVVHQERGSLVIQREVFERVLSPVLTVD